ncbi:hypothetical protein THAOC_22130, partial [Thalassiosira oceanica]
GSSPLLRKFLPPSRRLQDAQRPGRVDLGAPRRGPDRPVVFVVGRELGPLLPRAQVHPSRAGRRGPCRSPTGAATRPSRRSRGSARRGGGRRGGAGGGSRGRPGVSPAASPALGASSSRLGGVDFEGGLLGLLGVPPVMALVFSPGRRYPSPPAGKGPQGPKEGVDDYVPVDTYGIRPGEPAKSATHPSTSGEPYNINDIPHIHPPPLIVIFSGDGREMDSNPSRAAGAGAAGGAASRRQPAAKTEDAGAEAVPPASTRDTASPKIGCGGSDAGLVASTIDGDEVRRAKRNGSTSSARGGGVVRSRVGRGRRGVSSSAFLLPGLLLLLHAVASFASNLAVTAERDGRRTANVEDGNDKAGSFERILQEGKNESNGLFDHFDEPTGLNEGAESVGGAGPANGGGGGGEDEAWLQLLQSITDEPNDEALQPALNGDSCKHQLLISLVYDEYPKYTVYDLSKIGSDSIFIHRGAYWDHPDAVSAENATSYHAYNQNVCLLDDGDYLFSVKHFKDKFYGKYELRLATGEIIVSGNDGFLGAGMNTLFSLPYNESSITTMTFEEYISDPSVATSPTSWPTSWPTYIYDESSISPVATSPTSWPSFSPTTVEESPAAPTPEEDQKFCCPLETSLNTPLTTSLPAAPTPEEDQVEVSNSCTPCPNGAVDESVLVVLPGQEEFYNCAFELEYMSQLEEGDDTCNYQYPFVQKFCCPLATSQEETSSNVTSPQTSSNVSTHSPQMQSNVPTRSPLPGYVGRGWCLDAQDRKYKSIIDDGSREIRSPHDCLDLCESIPVSDPSQLVGFEYDFKSLYLNTCYCLYTTLPDVTEELRNELGISEYDYSFILPTPAPTVSKLPTYDAGCFDFSLSFLLPKVINHGLYYLWSVTSLDYEGISWGETSSVLVVPEGELSNSIVTKRPLDDRVCLPADSSYELQINIHGSHPASETVKGTGVWFVLSAGEEHISCGEFPYAAAADKTATYTSDAVTFTSSDRTNDCVLQPGQGAGSGKELLPLQCLLSAFPTTSQGVNVNSSEWTKPECLVDVCKSDPSSCGCQNIDQADYRGTVNSTGVNGVCSLWSDNLDVDRYSNDAGLVSNHCRNPGGVNPYGAWCFIDIGDWGKTRYECNVPLCGVDEDQPLLWEACESGSLGFASLDNEMEALCEHQHCVADRGGDAPCTCLLEQWEYNYGSKARGRSECCAAAQKFSKMTDFEEVQAASCKCTLRSDCIDLNIGEKCLAYSEYCCNDDECKCDFATRACRLALSNGDEDADELCARAENSCCTGPFTFLSYGDGGCRCDFWEVGLVWILLVDVCFPSNTISMKPLCNEYHISATCDKAEATCCNNDGQCSCLFLTYAADELNYVRQDKDAICIDANLQVPNQQQELEALQGLYEETGGESWSVKDGWLKDSDHCDWHGIECNKDGFVSAVELRGNRLVGRFPFKYLSELKKLEKLDHKESVADNGGMVTAKFCNELCRGDKISTAGSNLVGFQIWRGDVANLSEQCYCLYSDGELPLPLKDGVTFDEETPAGTGPVMLTDNDPDNVCYGYTPPTPHTFLDSRKLAAVNISHNDLSGPIDILFAPSVKSLDASHNNFTHVKPFKKYKSSHSLRSFDLSSNLISQEFATLFVDKPRNIEEINLSNNLISGPIQTSEQFDFLRRLIVGSNKLSGTLPNLPSKFPNLVDLNLSSNMITGSINDGLTNHLVLKTLDLSGNMLTSFDEAAVLSNLVQLNHMDLSDNELGPTIPREIGKLKDKLILLDLSNNNFISRIPSELGSLQSDATVRLAGNQFDNTFLAPLSVCTIGHSQDSQGYFDLSDQPEYCPSERAALADFYNKAKGLEWTESTTQVPDLATNQLLSSLVDPAPLLYRTVSWLDDYDSHCLWKGVTCEDGRTIKIELRANGLSGRLSSSIGMLKDLRVLDISDNDIKDTIPSEIGLLEQLEFLKLSFNQFQREVPPDIENLRKLKLFQAHGNRITGTVTLFPGLEPDKFEESSYVTDCGSPSLFGNDPGPVNCTSCTMCCNEFEECYPAKKNAFLEWKDYEDFGWILLACVIAYLCLLNGVSALWDYRKKRMQRRITRRSSRYIRQKSAADEKYAIQSMGEGSVYSFFLHDNKLAWSIALVTVAIQFWMLHPFIIAAEFDLSDDRKDLVYTWKCDRVSDKCEDLGDLTWQGWFLFGLLMTTFMGKDIVCGVKMITLSGKMRHKVAQRVRFFVGGTFLSCISVYMFYVSTIYNISIATTNTELIYNAVISESTGRTKCFMILTMFTIRSPRAVLFVMEIDERVFETIDTVNQRWVDKVTKREETAEAKISNHGIGEKSDGALTSEEVEALLEQHTRQIEDRDQRTRQLEERLQLIEAKNAFPQSLHRIGGDLSDA